MCRERRTTGLERLWHSATRPSSDALTALVAERGRWGFWKLFDRLRAQEHAWNHKRVHGVYCALRLNLPRRTVRRVPKRVRQPLEAPRTLNQTWAMDFMSDMLYDGRRMRLLTIIDEGNHEALDIGVGVDAERPRHPSPGRARPGARRGAGHPRG